MTADNKASNRHRKHEAARPSRASYRKGLRRLLFEQFEDRRLLAVIDLAALTTTQGTTILGVDAGDYSGHSVSSVGDFNGDGFDDFVIGAYTADAANNAKSNAGEAYLVFGSAAPASTLNLSSLGSGGVVIYGADATDLSGTSVGSAGDINGDGYGDVIIGARDGETVGFNRGESYILFGSASPAATISLDALGTSGVKILGVDSSDRSGTKVSRAGDINGDGFDDVLVGAPDAGGLGNTKASAGDSYLIFGAPTLPGVIELGSLGAGGVTIYGADANDQSGSSLSAAGDVNGDGFGDFLIGARFGDAAGNAKSNAGESYLIFGKSSMPQQIQLNDLAAQGVTFFGAEANDFSGYSVSGAGDINGDGFDDFLIGATNADGPNNSRSNAGETYLIYGKATFPASVDLDSLGSAGVVFYGADAFDESGVSVSNAGDVNGDGLDDLMIAAWRADGLNNSRGAAGDTAVVFGSSSFPATFDLASITPGSTNGVAIFGVSFYDLSGISTSSAGDINGDGFDDLLIGAEKVTRNSKSQVGESYLIFGGDGFTNSVTHLGTANNDTITGTQGADIIVGGRGNDTVIGNRWFDVLVGGQGHDVLSVSELNFKRIMGGTGNDTLELTGAGHWFDLRSFADNRIQGVEQVNITGSGGNTLALNQREVLNISDESNTLVVHGNSDDYLVLDAGWVFTTTEQINALPYRVLTKGAATLKVASAIAEPPPSNLDLVSIAGPSFGTIPGNGASSLPKPSADGRYVAFGSTADNLVLGDTRVLGPGDVFVRDMTNGITTRVSTDSLGNEANDSSFSYNISGNGRYVTFLSNASNLVTGDTNSAQDIFLKDLQTGVTTRVSINSSGIQGNGSSGSPSISHDGRYVAFQSFASNLVPGDTNGLLDIFVKDIQTGSITRISTDSGSLQSNAHSFSPEISGDGSVVVFLSDASNLVAGDTNGQGDVFAKDLATGVTSRVSISSTGAQGNGFSGGARISSNGRYVSFQSSATNFVTTDRNATTSDVFLKDRQTGTLVLVNANDAGLQTVAHAFAGNVSDNGRFVTFSSTSNELAPNDTNAVTKVFVKDLQTGVVTRISQTVTGFVGNGNSEAASISGDGQWVVFASTATNLNPIDNNITSDIYRAPFAVPASLSVSSSNGSWSIADTASGGKNNVFTLSRAGSDFVITSTGEAFPGGSNTLVISQAALTGSLTIDAAGGDDTLVLDFAGGNPLPAGFSFFGGAASNDKLIVSGATPNSVIYNATQAASGLLVLDGKGITFSGVESLDLTGSTLANLSVAVDPQSQIAGNITSTIAQHTTSSQTQLAFTQGLASLAVGNVTLGFTLFGETAASDTINLHGAGTGFTAGVSILGQGGADVVNLNGDWTLPGNRHFSVTSESFNLNTNADLIAQGSGMIIVVADNVELNETATATSGNSVTISPLTNQRPIDLGTDTAGSLSLTNAELARINGNILVGSYSSGAISITNTLAASGRSLRLRTGSGVSGNGSIINSHPTTAGEVIFDQLGASTYSGLLGGPAAGTNADKLLSIRKAGSGTLTLDSANTYWGWTSVDAGILRIGHAGALGSTISGTIVNSGGSLQLQNSIEVTGEFLGISGTGVGSTGALWSVSGSNSWSGPIELDAAATIGNQTDNLFLTTINNKGFVVTFNINDVSRLFGGLSGAGEVRKTGSGQLLFQAQNTYTGVTNILSGSINLVDSGTLGSTGAGTIVSNGATLAVLTTAPVLDDITVSGIGFTGFGAINGTDGAQLAGNVLLAGNTRIAKFNANSPFVISGDISDGGLGYGIEVRGSETGRTISLAGTNTYTGPTQLIEPVTLNVHGSLTSNISLVSDARLGGNGTVMGSVTSTGTGAVNPGSSGPGRLTVVGNYSANTIFDVQDDYLTAGSGGDYDQLIVQGATSQINLGTKTITFQSAGGGTAPLPPNFLTLISNETNNAIVPFSNLTAGSPVTLGVDAQARVFNSSYGGGNGRDLVLTGFTPNRAPTGSGGALNVLEDTVRVLAIGDFNFSDPDSDDSLQSVTLTSVPSLGQLYLDLNGNSSYDAATETLSAGSVVTVTQLAENRLRYLPPVNAFGFSYTGFGFRVSDGQLLSDPSGFTIHVTSVNDAPTFTAGSNQTIVEDAGPQAVNAWATNLSAGPANESGQTLNFQVISNSNPQLFSTTPTVSSSGTLSYAPALNAFGTAIIGVRLKDDGGTANGGINASALQFFTITVTPVPDDASDILLSQNAVAENSTAGTIIGSFSVAGGGVATFELVAGELDNALFTLSGNSLQAAGAFDYEARANHSVRVRTTLGSSTVIADFLILVTPVNEFAPSITSAQTYPVPENSTLVGTLTASDPDVPAPQFFFSIVGGQDQSRFTLVGNQLAFTAAPDFEAPSDANGDNIYLIQVSASDGVRISQTHTLTISVTEINEAPTSLTLSNLTFAESLPASSVIGILDAIDNDGPNPISFAFFGSSPNDNADFQIVGNQLISRREFDYETLADRQLLVHIVATDGFSATSSPAVFNLNVTDAPERPIALGQSLATTKNNAGLPVTLAGTGGASLAYAISGQPTNGTLVGTAPNLVYVPNSNFVGTDEFFFTVDNGSLTSFQAKVEIAVIGTKPTIQFSTTNGSDSEGIGTVNIGINLSESSETGFWIPIEVDTANSTASGNDFSLVSEVFVAPGETSISVPFYLVDDRTYEVNEVAVLRIQGTPAFSLGANATHALTILENDIPPTLSLSSTSSVHPESNLTTGTTLRLSATLPYDVTIGVSIGGSASAGIDYEPLPTTVTIPAGASSVFVPITLMQDTQPESPESIVIVFDDSSSLWQLGTTVDQRTFTLTTTDDDQRFVNVQYSVSVGEAQGSVLIRATLSSPPTEITRVPFVRSGNALFTGTTPDYFIPTPDEFVFGVGQTEATIVATIIDDSLVESTSEFFTLKLQSGVGYALGTRTQTSVGITDNDKALLSFTVANIEKWEGDPAFNITATLDRPLPSALSVPLVVSLGSGASYAHFADYSFPFNSFQFASGSLTSSRSFLVNNDTSKELTELLTIAFSDAAFTSTSLVSRGTITSTRISIQDNDPVVSIAAQPTVNEGSSAIYTFSLDAATNVPTVIPFRLAGDSVAGTHHVAPTVTSVTIPAGKTSVQLSIATINNSQDTASDPTLTVSIGSVANATVNANAKSATVKIKDNDVTVVDFPSADKKILDLSESRVWASSGLVNRTQSITVAMSAFSDKPVDVTLAFGGKAVRDSDYKINGLTNGKLRIPAGKSSASFELEIKHDTVYEGNETLTITIDSVSSPATLPKGAKPVRQLGIIEDDKQAVTKSTPPATSSSVKQTSSQQALPPGSLAIDLNPSITIPKTSSSAAPNVNLLNNGIFYKPGDLIIATGNQGPIEGATAFFDGNFNLILDDGEPSSATAIDGSFSLDINGFDTNQNEVLELSEGRFVLFGGVDLASGQTWKIPLTAPIGLFNITPISTLVESLVRTQNLSLTDAMGRATDALNIATYNLLGSNSIYEVLEKDGLAAKAYNSHTQLYSAVISIAQVLAGASGRSLDALGLAVFDQIAQLINTPDALLDLTQPDVIEGILRATASSQVITDLDDATIRSVASVISAGTSRLAAISLTNDSTGHQYLLSINQAKTILQGSLPEALFELGNGTKTIAQIVADFTGTALDAKISAIEATVTVPPAIGIDSLGMVEGNAGLRFLRFSVAVVGEHAYPISTNYFTVDGTAIEGNDYTSTSGVLTWAAGDNSTQYIDVPILGDTLFEADEYFKVLLGNSSGLVVRVDEGTGFILNDESTTITTPVDSPINDIRYNLSAEEASVFLNGEQKLTGEFANPLGSVIAGQNSVSDQFVLDFTANTFRADTIEFQGGAGPDTTDTFTAVAGLFETITYSIGGNGNATAVFVSDDPALPITVHITGVERSSLSVAEANQLVLHVPGNIASLIVEDTDANQLGRMRIRSATGAFAPIEFTNPTASLRIVRESPDTLVTVSSQDPAFTGVIDLGFVDVTRPSSFVNALPAKATSLQIPVSVTGEDLAGSEGNPTGVKEYDLYVAQDSGPFTKFATVPAAAPNAIFNATSNHTYFFRSVARDNAGNVEFEPELVPDAMIRTGDLDKPVTSVQSVTELGGGLFEALMFGSDSGGSQLTRFDLFVSVDNGTPTLVGSASAGAKDVNGIHSARLQYQGIADGLSHTYRFYSVGVDGALNFEAAPSSPDVLRTATYSAPLAATPTGIVVQQGAQQRSFIKTVDVLFSSPVALQSWFAAANVQIEKFAISAHSFESGGTWLTGYNASVQGGSLRLDFGSSGIGGSATTIAGDGVYRIRLDLDNNGSFNDPGDAHFDFFRLLGDANGDGRVNVGVNGQFDTLDSNVVDSLMGRVGANLDGDLNGSGNVNVTDKSYTTRQRGRRIASLINN